VDEIYVGYGWIGAITAMIAAKWALDLGYSQPRQLLWAIAGFFVPPLALLALYVRLVGHARPESAAGNSRG
jgi:hypothetical protein